MPRSILTSVNAAVSSANSFKRTTRRAASILTAALLVAALLATLDGCGAFSSSKSTAQTTTAPDFTTTLFLGDSLTAGFQNGSLLDTQQPNGWAPQLAKQANFTIRQPLVSSPGAPAVLQLKSAGPPPVIVQSSGVTTGRDDVTVQATDLAVPGHLVNDVLNTPPTGVPSTGQEIITYLVLGFPGIAQGQLLSQAQWAKQLNPTTIFLWIGNNDALVAVDSGPAAMTQVATFTTQITQLLQYLQTNTKAKLIVANIPDVTQVAKLTPAATLMAEFNLTSAQLTALGVDATDLVTAAGVTQIQAILSGSQTGQVSATNKLTTAEVATIQQTVTQYNQAIAAQVSAVGGTLVDMSAALSALHTTPPTINGQVLGFGYLGGFFSLDGVHPTNTGYAILANVFIDAMNSALKTTITDINVSTVAAADPLFPPHISANAALRPQSIPSHAANATDWMTKTDKRDK